MGRLEVKKVRVRGEGARLEVRKVRVGGEGARLEVKQRLGSEVRARALRLSLSACSGRLPTTYHLLLTTYYLP